jgi:hypothetical protein
MPLEMVPQILDSHSKLRSHFAPIPKSAGLGVEPPAPPFGFGGSGSLLCEGA